MIGALASRKLMRQHNHGVHLRYRDHHLVDGGKARHTANEFLLPVFQRVGTLWSVAWETTRKWAVSPRPSQTAYRAKCHLHFRQTGVYY
jgi:hypothetical protein